MNCKIFCINRAALGRAPPCTECTAAARAPITNSTALIVDGSAAYDLSVPLADLGCFRRGDFGNLREH